MKLGIMQPYFPHYLGYISLIKNVDKSRKQIINFLLKNNFEVLKSDDSHVVRQSWIFWENRVLE